MTIDKEQQPGKYLVDVVKTQPVPQIAACRVKHTDKTNWKQEP